jgi:hypothetical protein
MVLGVGLAGCVDKEPVAAPEARLDLAGAALRIQEDAANELARAIALAMQDAGIRQRVKNDMRMSPFFEHKLELRQYLHGQSGGILLAKMAHATGRSRDNLLALLNSVPPLEFYMPVIHHRTSWRGGANLLIATALSEEMTPIGYNLDGSLVSLSKDTVPEMPTLVLVPVETDFSNPIDLRRYRNSEDQDGQVIGNYQRRPESNPNENAAWTVMPYSDECPPEVIIECTGDGGGGGGGGGGWAPPSGAVFQRGIGIREIASHLKTPNDHEPWLKGAPEFRLFFVGASDASGNASLHQRVTVPEGPWSGSDDDNNAKWRLFEPLPLVEWDTDFGNRIQVKCMEEDWDITGKMDITVSGTTTIGGASVNYSCTWKDELNKSSDDCGQYAMLVRLSTGEWTAIPDARMRNTYFVPPPGLDLHWVGYGMSLIP